MLNTLKTVATQTRKNAYIVRALLRKYGVVGTARVFVDDVWFDLRHRTDTFLPVHQTDLFDPEDQANRHKYVPSPGSLVRNSVKLLDGLVDPNRAGFVDIGSGKGKVLIEARKVGFRQVSGVEYSTELHHVAAANMAKLKLDDIKLFNVDARDWRPTAEDQIFFFFNPFTGQMLDDFLATLVESPGPETRYAIYANPQCPEIFEKHMRERGSHIVQPGAVRVKLYEFAR